jgi:hypothetical protein
VTQRGMGGSRRAKTGRVTPSKVRRTAVVAVDGVLAVGTGALAGLFAAGGGMASGNLTLVSPVVGGAPT